MAFSVAPAAGAETANNESTPISAADTRNEEADPGTDTPDSEDGEEEDSEGLDPTKDMWDEVG